VVTSLVESSTTESFKQSSKKLKEIIEHQSLNAESKWSLMYAKKYVDQNDISVAQNHL